MSLSMRWDLSKLYTSFDAPEFSADLERITSLLAEAKTWTEKELTNPDNAVSKLHHIIEISDDVHRSLHRLGAFTHLTLATDATHKQALQSYDRLEKVQLDAENLESVYNRFIGTIDNLDDLIASDDKLKEYEFLLHESQAKAQYLLSPEVEPVVSRMSITGANAWSRMRDMIDGTMMVDVQQDGETKSLPLPMVRNMAYSEDPAVRKAGYEAELAAYPRIEMALNHSLNAIKGENLTTCEMRGYDSILHKTLEDSRMTQETLDAMLSAMVDAMPDFRRYFKAKAKVLGHEGGLPFYDLFAPLGESNRTFTYEEARDFLVKTFKDFSPEMSEYVDHAFANQWIDAESRQGKAGGAFCANLNFIGESRILSNFDGSMSQVFTLAHELGHGWHGHCLKHLPILKTSYPMPLAETASIFNETLVTNAAMKTADDDEKFALLEADLMNSSQVIVDIYSRYLFESKVIDTRSDHSMSVDEMKGVMIQAQKDTYGDGLDENAMHPYMWACKGHYYIPTLAFYNWPYAFGLLFGKGVYAQYMKMGDAFVADYKKLLAATGSANVADVAKMMDIDVTSKAFWKQSLDEIIKDIDLFCELADKKVK